MLALTPYELGRLVGAIGIGVVVPVAMAIWSIRLRRKQSEAWWVPLLIGGLLFLGSVASLVARTADRVAGERSTPVARLDPEEAFSPIEGFRFRRLPPDVEREAREALESDPSLRRSSTGLAFREVTTGSGSTVATAMVIGFEEHYAAQPVFLPAFTAGMVAETGGEPVERTLEGVTIREFTGTKGTVKDVHFIVWRWENLVVTLQGIDPGRTEEVARAMIREQS